MPKQQSKKFLILGGSSKVWRLTAGYWFELPGTEQTRVVSRREGAGIDTTLSDLHENPESADVVIALWGATAGTERALSLNKRLAKDAVEIARNCGARLVLQASSAAVYPARDTSLSEDTPLMPRNAYGRSKRDAERVKVPAHIKLVNMRLGNVAGADHLALSINGKTEIRLDQWANGRFPSRSYVDPEDLAESLLALASIDPTRLPTAINVSGQHPVSMAELLVRSGQSFLPKTPAEDALLSHFLDTTQLGALIGQLKRSSDPSQLARHLCCGA